MLSLLRNPSHGHSGDNGGDDGAEQAQNFFTPGSILTFGERKSLFVWAVRNTFRGTLKIDTTWPAFGTSMILSFLGVYQAGYPFSLMGIVLALGNGCLLVLELRGVQRPGSMACKTKRPAAAGRRSGSRGGWVLGDVLEAVVLHVSRLQAAPGPLPVPLPREHFPWRVAGAKASCPGSDGALLTSSEKKSPGYGPPQLIGVLGGDPFRSAHAAIPVVVVSACLSRWFQRPAL